MPPRKQLDYRRLDERLEDFGIYSKLIRRETWRALPPRFSRRQRMVKMVLITDTGGPECKNQDDCCCIVNDLQAKFLTWGYEDIPWNFLLGGDGNVYEGRGWKIMPEKVNMGDPIQRHWEGRSMDVAYIGDFLRKHITNPIRDALNYLMYMSDKMKALNKFDCMYQDLTMTREKYVNRL